MKNLIKRSRGYVIGMIFGCVLTIGFTANAAVTDMIGKVIDGQFPLLVNGVQTEKPAIVIEGTSYIPVRAAGEQFGYDISFVDSQIIMKPLEGVVNLDALQKYKQDRQAAGDKLMNEQQKQIDDNNAKIKAEQDAAAKIRAEGDAEAAKVKAELDAKAKETAQQIQPGN